MVPYAFTYRRAKTLAEARGLLKGDAKLLAGGQTLIAGHAGHGNSDERPVEKIRLRVRFTTS